VGRHHERRDDAQVKQDDERCWILVPKSCKVDCSSSKKRIIFYISESNFQHILTKYGRALSDFLAASWARKGWGTTRAIHQSETASSMWRWWKGPWRWICPPQAAGWHQLQRPLSQIHLSNSCAESWLVWGIAASVSLVKSGQECAAKTYSSSMYLRFIFN